MLAFTPHQVLDPIQQELRAVVGQTAFEELAHTWLAEQGRRGQLPFTPQAIGQHWSRHVQVDVVAINWESRDILLGECKWGHEPVSRQMVRELIEQKTSKVVGDLSGNPEAWRVHYAFFARNGFTPAAEEALNQHQALAITLSRMDADLSAP